MEEKTEKYFEQLKRFGSTFLNGFDGDVEKATLALDKTNEFMESNQNIIPWISDEENQKILAEIPAILTDNKMTVLQKVAKVMKIGKKLK